MIVFTSYSQNFEDVMIWRALAHIKNGFYIDVGAHHPTIDSVSKAFYEHGWRGIHVEPVPAYADLLRHDRPDEVVIQSALAAAERTLKFFEIQDTGLSTANQEIAKQHANRGFSVREIIVPSITLGDLFTQTGRSEVHWLKIDVEGCERDVLKGWGRSTIRPWLVIVESVHPVTRKETYRIWEPLLLKRGYAFVYFDGLNRFYLNKQHPELTPSFHAAPNVFDSFTLSGMASSSFCGLLNSRLREADASREAAIAELRQAHAEQQSEASAAYIHLNESLRSSEAKIKHLADALGALQREATDCERNLLERFAQQLQNGNEDRRALEEHFAAREALLTRHATESRRETEELLRLLREREETFTKQMIDFTKEAELARAADAQAFSKREERLIHQVETTTETLLAAQQRAVAREEAFAKQLLDLSKEADLARAAGARAFGEREGRLTYQLEATTEALLASQQRAVEREEAFAKQLLEFSKQAELARAADTRAVGEREERLIHQLETTTKALLAAQQGALDREQTLRQQVERIQEEIKALQGAGSERERALTAELMELRAAVSSREVALTHDAAEAQRHVETLRTALADLERDSTRQRLSESLLTRAYESERELWQTEIARLRESPVPLDARAVLPTWSVAPSVIEPETSNGPLTTLDALLGCRDADFIRASYLAVLGRMPDPAGFTHYLTRLRAGVSKLQILADLRFSPEGRTRSVGLDGLDITLRRYQLGRLPAIGWIIRRLFGLEGGTASERRWRAFENQMHSLAESIGEEVAGIGRSLAHLRDLSEQTRQGVLASFTTANRIIADEVRALTGRDTSIANNENHSRKAASAEIAEVPADSHQTPDRFQIESETRRLLSARLRAWSK